MRVFFQVSYLYRDQLNSVTTTSVGTAVAADLGKWQVNSNYRPFGKLTETANASASAPEQLCSRRMEHTVRNLASTV
ncbi:MAG: hypothetical protein QNL16_00130 [Rhodobacterales bacterium]|jgi:hypothetical protein|nr:hypothetical protein [Pseudomonadota bacterium]MDA1286614.1 hypothetical protein [Pseudomonadota bacterium]NQW14074.1 hypothetical protein [Rhodobacter sp.]